MKRLNPGQRVATCRVCGAQGIEDANDPAPGLCPRCFEDHLFGQTVLFIALVSEPEEATLHPVTFVDLPEVAKP